MPTVSELFVLQYGHSLELNRLEQSTSPDAVNFVSRTARNNGVSARVRPIPGIEPSPAGTITVALSGQGGAGEAFLQPFPYYSGFHVMVLTPKDPMSEREKLWWATCITANRFRFGFGRQANKALKSLSLPSPSKMPSWVSGVDTQPFDGAAAPFIAATEPLASSAAWHSFALEDLFEIRKGRRRTKADMRPGLVPFIGAVEKNNGVSGFVSDAIHAGNTITVSYNGSVAEAFYQSKPFWASDDVNVLYPRFAISGAAALFVCTVIRREKYRFNYGRKWDLTLMKKSVIKLPARADGAPDWAHMERFIKTLPFSSQLES